MGADAAIVQAATWTAVAIAACLLLSTRGALGIALGVAVIGGGVAFAGSGGGSSPQPPAVSADWPVARPARTPAAVAVRRGDCLWAIAARRLTHPTPADIAVAWPRWWTANRRLIGADPNLVRPGQRLRPPRNPQEPS